MADDSTHIEPVEEGIPDPKNDFLPRSEVEKARREAAGYKHRAKELAEEFGAKATALEKALEAHKAETEKRVSDAKAEADKRADDRVINAELKAEALKAGMIDLDLLKLADKSKLSLNEDGEVIGAGDLIKALTESKPYAFEAKTDTATKRTAPPPKPSTIKTAREMTPEEYKVARAKIK